MKGLKQNMKNLLIDECGQDLIEYALVAALVGLGAVGSMKTLATTSGGACRGLGNRLQQFDAAGAVHTHGGWALNLREHEAAFDACVHHESGSAGLFYGESRPGGGDGEGGGDQHADHLG